MPRLCWLTASPAGCLAAAMTDLLSDRLAGLGIALPEPAPPGAPHVPGGGGRRGLHLSGQLPFRPDGSLTVGGLGEDVGLEQGRQAAERCAIMLLAQIDAALGSLERVERIVRLGVFVASAANFTDQPKVANGASELMETVFGEAGRHARSAVGVPVLPLGAAVEVDGIVAIR